MGGMDGWMDGNTEMHTLTLTLQCTAYRSELASRNLPTKGLKKELSERLIENLENGGGGGGGGQLDPSAQVAGEAPEVADGTQHSTDNLPSEMPAVPPANEVSVKDFEGTEPTLSETTAATNNGNSNAETIEEMSEVVRPPPDSVDKIPGVVFDSKAIGDDPAAQDAGLKRKRDDEAGLLIQPRR